ncbi:MAG: hypothetical protein Q9159_005493 [Coniocarpon cinnabarinum]
MTVPNGSRPTSSLSIPATQNTSPVYEHNCLYTYDIRRKNVKRWQDGLLRFHTFNKRIMLYDLPRNFIGDTHWQESDAVEDGDEVILEKAGVLVQVCEKIATNEADLTGLWDHRREKEKRVSAGTPGNARLGQGTLTPRNPNALPKTPRPLTGRAQLPTKSPFEERQARLQLPLEPSDDRLREEGRPSKRPRNDENHIPLWQVLRSSRPAQHRSAQLKAPHGQAQDSEVRDGNSSRNSGASLLAQKLLAARRKQGTLRVADVVDLTASSSPDGGNVIETTAQRPKKSTPADSAHNRGREGVPARNGWFAMPGNESANHRSTESATNMPMDIDKAAVDSLRATSGKNHLRGKQNEPLLGDSEQTKRVAKPLKQRQSNSLFDSAKPNMPVARSRQKSPPVGNKNHLPTVEDPVKDKAAAANHRSSAERPAKSNDEDRKERTLRVITRPERKKLSCLENLSLPATNITSTSKEKDSKCHENQAESRNLNGLNAQQNREPAAGDVITVDSSPAFETQEEKRAEANARRKALDRSDNLGCRVHRPVTTSGRSLPPHARLDAEFLAQAAVSAKHTERAAQERAQGRNLLGQSGSRLNGKHDRPPSRARVSTLGAGAVDNVSGETSVTRGERAAHDDCVLTEQESLNYHDSDGEAFQEISRPSDINSSRSHGQFTDSPRRRLPSTKATTGSKLQSVDAQSHDAQTSHITNLNSHPKSAKRKASDPNPKPRLMQSLRRSATVAGPSNTSIKQQNPITTTVTTAEKTNTKSYASTLAPRPDKGAASRQTEPQSESDSTNESKEETGPWTIEAFDLFGDDVFKAREAKTGQKVAWLEKYISDSVATGADEGRENGKVNREAGGGFETAARVLAMA